MKRLYILILLVISQGAMGQYDISGVEEKSKKESKVDWFKIKERTYIGGEFGLSIAQGYTYLHTAPLVGFDITDRFSAGVSLMYQLQRIRDYNGNVYNFNSVGAGIFARYKPIEPLLLQVEFNQFNTVDWAYETLDRVNVSALMAGIGYSGQLGDRAYSQFLVMYDFINDPNMPLPPFLIPQVHLKIGFVWYLA